MSHRGPAGSDGRAGSDGGVVMAATPHVLSLSESVLHYSGLWPRSRGKMSSLYSLFICASIPCITLVVASFYLYDQEVLPVARIDAAVTVLGTLPLIASVLMLLLRRRRFQDLISSLRTFAARTLREDTRHLLLQMVARERKAFTVFTCLASFSAVMLIAAPVLQHLASPEALDGRVLRRLPFIMYPLWDEDDLALFAALYVLQAALACGLAVAIVASDGFTVTLMLYASYQFEVVAALIRSADSPRRVEESGAEESAPPPGAAEEQGRAWKLIVTLHQDALRNGHELCELFRTTFFVYYAVTSLELSMFLYEIIKLEDKSQKMKYATFLVRIMQRLFIVSYLATDIKTKSEAVEGALTATAWYVYSPQEKTIIQIMMCWAQRGLKMWAGRFAVMSLETYLGILNAAYSYFNILDTLN